MHRFSLSSKKYALKVILDGFKGIKLLAKRGEQVLRANMHFRTDFFLPHDLFNAFRVASARQQDRFQVQVMGFIELTTLKHDKLISLPSV